MKPVSGFTLMELMITLTVVGVLATIGAPSFLNMIQDNRTTTQTNELVTALNLARSEAIKRGEGITVAATNNDFANGWCVHLGADCTGNDVIREYSAMRQMDVQASALTMTFDGRGFKSVPANNIVTVVLAPAGCPSGSNNRARQLNIANTGRVNVDRMDCP
jgi:type IV fimbrial biogenesis protein FimT